MFKRIVVHFNTSRIHHGDTRSVFDERVFSVFVVVREHKVKAIPDISLTVIFGDQRVGYELEIDPVPVTLYCIVVDGDVIAFPQVNTVSDLMFRFRFGFELIVLDPRLGRV